MGGHCTRVPKFAIQVKQMLLHIWQKILESLLHEVALKIRGHKNPEFFFETTAVCNLQELYSTVVGISRVNMYF